jgi:hypothetical protein
MNVNGILLQPKIRSGYIDASMSSDGFKVIQSLKMDDTKKLSSREGDYANLMKQTSGRSVRKLLKIVRMKV